jgi:polyhydroxybutyrate depolymerase
MPIQRASKLVSLVLMLLMASASASDQQITVQVGTQTRTCLVHLPPVYDGKRDLPLLVAFHGSGSTGKGAIELTGFNAMGDRCGFIAAYPDGITGKNHGWTALFGKPIPSGHGAQVDDVDDIGFVRTLIDQLHQSYYTDPARVFVCGHSSGAYMAYRVAIDLADRVAAAGVVNGSMGIRLLDGEPSIPDIPKPVAPISIIHICGGKDNLVKFAGTQTATVCAWSVPQCVQHFVMADGCSMPGKQTRDAEHGVVRTRYCGGKAGTEVNLVLVENCGHNWPIPQCGLSASQELWDFFASHPKAATTVSSPTPGSTFTVQFPELPPTFYDLAQKKDVKPQMTVFLPTNYDPARKHPLLVFLGGGDGGTGSNPSVARELSAEEDFICVGVPLFKVTDPKASGGDFVMRDPDGRYMWPFFRTMLAKLEELVPNIDPAHRVLGGFSNGAHAVQGLIDESDGEIARRFSAFFFVEGGGRLEHYDLLRGKPYLMVSSNTKSRPRAQEICDAAKAAGARATLVAVDVGQHDFPKSAYPAVQEWLRGPAMK